MRPEAAEFSPRETSSAPPDGWSAVVPYTATRSDGRKTTTPPIEHLSFDGNKTTPEGLIVHESIKGLLEQVFKVNIRCEGVEATHAELKDALATLQSNPTSPTPATCGDGNLTGYSSSDDSTEEERGRSPTRKATQPMKLEDMEEILFKFAEKINAQEAHQEQLEVRFTQDSQDKTMLEQRITAVEEGLMSLKAARETSTIYDPQNLGATSPASTELQKDVQEMKNKIEAIEESIQELKTKPLSKVAADPYGLDRLDESGDSNFTVSASAKTDMATFWADEIDKMKRILKMVHMGGQKAVEELSEQVKALGAVVEGRGVGGSAEYKTSNWESDSSNEKPAKASKQDVVDLKQWQGRVLQQAKNNQLIDEASQRDTLYAMYFQLSAIMERGDGNAFWMEGPFQATSEEAFSLRDRVLCRLALFDRYAEVLEEVQAQEGKIDW